MKNSKGRSGIYLVYPKSKEPQSIWKPKGYKTKVNCNHTKVGKTNDFAGALHGRYIPNFGDVEFFDITEVPQSKLAGVEKAIHYRIKQEGIKRVGRSREWYDTTDRTKLKDIILQVVAEFKI